MRAPRQLPSLVSLGLCLCGCVQLPTVGFGVRSSFRTSARPLSRSVELLTGMTVGWSGARREALAVAVDDRATEINAAPIVEAAQAPCAAPVFCDWEIDQRRAALAREGLGDRAADLDPGGFR
jgi:hypothetical protein